MKRLMILLTVITIGYVAGDSGLLGSLQAQAPAGQGRGEGRGQSAAPTHPRAATNLFLVASPPETKMQLGKAVHWTREEQAAGKGHLQWSGEYRLTPTTRPGSGQQPESGELHTDNTQIYLITGGSGTVIVDAKVDPANDYTVAPGEHRGGPLTGGRLVKVKVGDLLSIPPYSWHVGWGDKDVPLQYLIIHINTRTTAP